MSITLVPCPLCDFDGAMLPLVISDEDAHIRDYGELYAGRSKSEWKACGRCGFVHQNPRPSAEALNEFYARGSYHAPLRVDPHLVLWMHRGAYSDNVEAVTKGTGLQRGSVLDLGCGYGIALGEFKKLGWTCYGVEPDSGRVAFAHETLGIAGVRCGLADEQLSAPERVDVVISHHAFEHFADLKSVMRGVRNVVKPGGYFFARIPTYFKNRSRMSILYMNSGHYSMFTHESMSQLLAPYGFERVAHSYLNKSGIDLTDDLLYLARYTGVERDPRQFYQSPAAVQRYVNHTNPVRSRVFAPVYALAYKRLAERLRLNFIRYGVEHPLRLSRLVADRLAGRASA
jgi:2-polyprenyl-3-methyl-5-hydroxy-6-metoxy-1,4-benzoquinol methylase